MTRQVWQHRQLDRIPQGPPVREVQAETEEAEPKVARRQHQGSQDSNFRHESRDGLFPGVRLQSGTRRDTTPKAGQMPKIREKVPVSGLTREPEKAVLRGHFWVVSTSPSTTASGW